MPLLADTHLHVYPTHDVDRLLDSAWLNLSALSRAHAPGAELALFLTERSDCSFFRNLPARVGDWAVEPGAAPAHRMLVRNQDRLHLFAGRQMATREKLEVLALLTDQTIPDGESVQDTIARAWDAGAFPVMPWSMGKWTLRRAGIVRRVLAGGRGPGAVGDILRRPRWWWEPRFAQARRQNLPLLAGTDPLPLPGQETVAGRMASLYQGNLDWTRPSASLITSWLSEPTSWRTVRL